jgi:Ca2+-transporting ATPase
MAKRNVIVRKLSSVETLGCTSVICTDKTGTLTTNQMTVKKIVTLKRPRDNDVYSKSNTDDIEVEERTVEGTSYEPVLGAVNGFSWTNSNTIFFQDFAAICALCNNAQIKYDIADTSFHHLGEPTEAALKVLVEKLGVPKSPHIELLSSNPIQMAHQSSDYWSQRYAYLAELEFSRDRKMMSVVLRDLNLLRNRIFTKGAAEIVLSRCNRIKLENGDVVPMTPSLRLKISRSFESMAKQSFRCLGLAYKDASEVSNELNSVESPDDSAQLPLLNSPERFELCERDMVFVGMCGILDPPRPEVRSAILKTGEAGVRVFMITGDSKQTATAIAKEVGILDNDTGDIGGRVFNGKDFFNLSKQNQVELLKQRGNLVFCRAEPQQKQMLVRLLSEIGEVIAMTGDGVNDAPALQQADIGIAMGITGTEVSKNAADMILADDNFSSIVSAIEEGRGIYNNMKTFIFFLVSSNIGEVLSIFTAALLGLPDLLTPVHLLWVNLVTDGVLCSLMSSLPNFVLLSLSLTIYVELLLGPPATALSFNPSGRDVMKQPPRSRYEPLFTKSLLLRLLASGSYVAFATIGSFVWWFLDKGVSMTDLMKWESTKTKAGSEGSGGTLYQILSTSLAPPQTIALSVLVLMELMKALSAVSLDSSMLTSPPWRNPTLIVGTLVPLVAHLFFMYVPALSTILRLSPLSLREWKVRIV